MSRVKQSFNTFYVLLCKYKQSPLCGTSTGHGYKTSDRHTQQIITDMQAIIGCREAMNTVKLVENSNLGILLFKVHKEKLSVFIFPYNTDDFGDHPEILLMCK